MGSGPIPHHAPVSAYARNLIQRKARQISRRAGFSRSDVQDIEQDLTLALLRKLPQFDPRRGASPDTFADRVIISAVKMMLRDAGRQKRAAGRHARSLNEEPKL